MKAIVAERGQVTIPKALREKLGLAPGSVLDFFDDHGRLVAVKHASQDAVSKVMGCLGKKIDVDKFIAGARGAVE